MTLLLRRVCAGVGQILTAGSPEIGQTIAVRTFQLIRFNTHYYVMIKIIITLKWHMGVVYIIVLSVFLPLGPPALIINVLIGWAYIHQNDNYMINQTYDFPSKTEW